MPKEWRDLCSEKEGTALQTRLVLLIVVNPAKMCDVETHTIAQQSRRVHTHFACYGVPGIILVELRATEPAEDAHQFACLNLAQEQQSEILY